MLQHHFNWKKLSAIAGGSGTCALERNGKATPAREAPARGDGQDNWSLGQLVERGRGNDQYRAGALLFMAGSGIDADEPDVTPVHYSSSLPTDLASIQVRSSGEGDSGLSC